MSLSPSQRRLVIHGHAVELVCEVPAITAEWGRWLGVFQTEGWPESVIPARGTVAPFEPGDVMRCVSPNAVSVYYPEQMLDIYREGEQYWLVDDRWGICHINLLKRTWKSWVIDQPRIDTVRLLEWTLHWPMAQVLRGQGLHLVPAIGISRDGFAMLLIGEMSLTAELQALANAGFKIIGQRWIALREEDGRVGMLSMPGMVELPIRTEPLAPFRRAAQYVDLLDTFLGAHQHHAFCDAVVLVEGGRRGPAALQQLDPEAAAGAVRRGWPIAELHPVRVQGLAYRLSTLSPVFSLQLSRDPADALRLLSNLRYQHISR